MILKNQRTKLLKIIKGLNKASGLKIRSLIAKAESTVIRILAEIALNIHKRSLGIPNYIKRGLQKFNDLLHKFGCSYGAPRNIEKNREILLKHPLSKGKGLGLFIKFLVKASSKLLSKIVESCLFSR